MGLKRRVYRGGHGTARGAVDFASVKGVPVPVDEVDLEADRNDVSVVVNPRSIRYGTLPG